MAALLATAGPCDAAVDVMAGFYTGTLYVTDRGTGFVSTVEFNSDNTFIANVMQDGKPVQVWGAWAVQPGGWTVCLASRTQGVRPTPATDGCAIYGGHVAGDAWSVSNDRGQILDLRLSAGR
jgi:hypothetical protein